MKERYYSALLFQSIYRRHQAKLFYKNLRRRLLPPIIVIQRHWRGYTARSAYITTIDSVIRVQSFARGPVLVKAVLLPSWHHSATAMQSIWRGFWVQLHYQIQLLDIIATQCLSRRWAAIRLAETRRTAWRKLQYAGRRFLAVRALYHKRRQKAAAIVIQVRL